MKAIICTKFGPVEDLAFTDVSPSPVSSADVRVAIRHAAVNLSDELMVRGEYQLKPETPFSPGSNGSGVVVEVGADVSRIKVGDRVSAGHFYGTYAEELVTDESRVVRVPDEVSLEHAAALRIAHGTALFALEVRGGLTAGETVVVTGAAGGVGLATVEVARLLGANVIACVGSSAKADIALRHGAHHVVDYSKEDVKDRIREITNDRGADVILDVVGGDLFRTLLSSMAFGGRLLVVGFASGTIPNVPANLPLLKNVSICGVFFGAWSTTFPERARQVHSRVLNWCADGKIKPHVSATYSLEDAVDAMRFVKSREATGRVLLNI